MNEDEILTAQSTALSPALRALVGTPPPPERQQLRIELTHGPLVLWFPVPMTADDVSDTEAVLAILIGSLKRRFARHEPRGLSASEPPGAAAVTPNPPEVS